MISPDTLAEVRALDATDEVSLYHSESDGSILQLHFLSPSQAEAALQALKALALLSPEPAATPPAAKSDSLEALVVAEIIGRMLPADSSHVLARAVLSALDIPRREAEAAEREREACAKVADELQVSGDYDAIDDEDLDYVQTQTATARSIAAAIHARSPAAKAQDRE